jgi:predicted Zn-ribbon and HTH transcriptional regulator
MPKGPLFTAEEELLEIYDVERCPECRCATGDDTEYKDFSNKRIAVCAQCGYEWHLDEMKRVREPY